MRGLSILISGSGSNLQAIMDAGFEIDVVVSNRKEAYGLERAKKANIPTLYFPLKPYKDSGKIREEYDADLAKKIGEYQPHLIILAGWMHIFSAAFLDQFPRKVINLHPALPDTFPGTHAIQRAFDAYRAGEITHSGCMVHYVIPEVDAGEVITQAVVPILPEDTLETFEERMHETEHRIIVEAIKKVMG